MEVSRTDRQQITKLDRLTVIGRSFLSAISDIGTEGAIAHAASISYYTILSIFPFLLLVVVVSTRVLSDPALSVQAIQWLGSYLPAGKEILLDALPVLQRTSGSLGIFSVVGLAWSSMGLFSALRGALDQMMGVKTKSSAILTHWASLVSVIVASFGLLILIALSTILTMLGHVSLEGVSQTISQFGPLAATVATWLLLPAGMALQLATLFLGQFMTWLAIVLVLQYMPRKHPGFRNCMIPAFVVTIFVEFLKTGFLWSIQSSGNFTVINGPLAAAIAVMLWAYLTSLMLLFGAAWAKNLRRQRNMLDRRRIPDEYENPAY